MPSFSTLNTPSPKLKLPPVISIELAVTFPSLSTLKEVLPFSDSIEISPDLISTSPATLISPAVNVFLISALSITFSPLGE